MKWGLPYPLVVTNIATENPNHKWRFIAGKIIYFDQGHLHHGKLLVITRGYTPGGPLKKTWDVQGMDAIFGMVAHAIRMGDIRVVEETNGWENELMKPSGVGGFFHHDEGEFHQIYPTWL